MVVRHVSEGLPSRQKILVIDVGGSKVKLLASGQREWRSFETGRSMRPKPLANSVKRMTRDWDYDVITLGYPGHVVFGRIIGEPPNLGKGWIGFDFRTAFNRPVKIVNDAVLPALGSYRGGSMLFIGLGTGLGSVMIVDGIIEIVPLGGMPFKRSRAFGEHLDKGSLNRLGLKRWEQHVHDAVRVLKAFFEVDYIALGGGNVESLERIPRDVVLVGQDAAFEGGRRLWGRRGPVVGQPVPAKVRRSLSPRA